MDHDLAISADSLRVKSRLHKAALAFPEIAVAGEQPQADYRCHDLLGDSRLIILVGVSHQYIVNPIWMVDHDNWERPEVKGGEIAVLSLIKQEFERITIKIVEAADEKLSFGSR